MAPTASEWIERFARELGIDPPDEEELGAVLALAGTAAHASDRTAAPVSCWLAARAGIGAADAVELAGRLAGELG
jgi:hypothetical protein